MRTKTWLASLAIVTAMLLAGCAERGEARTGSGAAQTPTILTPEQIEWNATPAGLPPGVRVAALSGDPAQPGLFTMRVEIPPNVTIPRHTHPATEHVTILSGTAYVEIGREGERANATMLPEGSFFQLPAGTEHVFFTGSEPVVLQTHGEGPWGIEYVNATDPSMGGPAGSY